MCDKLYKGVENIVQNGESSLDLFLFLFLSLPPPHTRRHDVELGQWWATPVGHSEVGTVAHRDNRKGVEVRVRRVVMHLDVCHIHRACDRLD